jgi:hypothetical protein
MLMPSRHHSSADCKNSRSAMHCSFNFSCLFFSKHQSRKQSLLRKWWMKGSTCPRCTHHPMFISSSAFDVHPCSIMSEIAREQAINLFFGRAIVIVQKFNNQPRMTFVLVSPVSAFSFAHASMSSHGRGQTERLLWRLRLAQGEGLVQGGLHCLFCQGPL